MLQELALHWPSAAGAFVLCFLMFFAEGKLSDARMQEWFRSLRKPALFAPMWFWIIVALLTYTLQGVIAYRLLNILQWPQQVALAGLIAVMVMNVTYNVILARTRSARFIYTGIVWFVPPLLVLEMLLLWADPVSAALNAIYIAWVILYDLPIMRGVWKLNS